MPAEDLNNGLTQSNSQPHDLTGQDQDQNPQTTPADQDSDTVASDITDSQSEDAGSDIGQDQDDNVETGVTDTQVTDTGEPAGSDEDLDEDDTTEDGDVQEGGLS